MTQNDDLVHLAEGAAIVGVKPATVRMAELRKRRGMDARDADTFPDPVILGRTARLWSLRSLQSWADSRLNR